jgi:hypothetical protein
MATVTLMEMMWASFGRRLVERAQLQQIACPLRFRVAEVQPIATSLLGDDMV